MEDQTKRTINLNDFAILFLTSLGKNKDDNFLITLPFKYKEYIENIVYNNIFWQERFYLLLDNNEYTKDQVRFEQNLSRYISNIMKERTSINLENDTFEISIPNEEISEIIKLYIDRIPNFIEIYSIMIRFSKLIINQYNFQNCDQETKHRKIAILSRSFFESNQN